MFTTRLVALALVMSTAVTRPLHAQEPESAAYGETYTLVHADSDIMLVEHAVGLPYDEARARLLAHPALALSRILARTSASAGSLTATERERLADVARELGGQTAADQVLATTPATTPTYEPMPPSLLPMPSHPVRRARSPEGPPLLPEGPALPSPEVSRKKVLGGVVGILSGAAFAGLGIAVAVSTRHRADNPTPNPDEPKTTRSTSPAVGTAVGATFAVLGSLVMALGAWSIVTGRRDLRAWEDQQAKRSARLLPSVGRSARGTWTAGFQLRF